MENATILHVPHASTKIPKKYLHSFRRDKLAGEIAVMTDWFCDELFDVGRDRVVFPVSRLVCDVERFRDDEREVMSQIGMGAVYEACSDLSFLRSVTENEREQILAEYYDTHHQKFSKTVEYKLKTFGRCIIIDCHSFYPTPLPYEVCQEKKRPDFCIGTSDFHTPASVTNTLCSVLCSKGYTVGINKPFAGTIVPMKFYEKATGVVSVMIEVNRKLYLESPGVKSKSFSEIRAVLRECVEKIEEIYV